MVGQTLRRRRTTRLQWARWTGTTDRDCRWRSEGADGRVYKVYARTVPVVHFAVKIQNGTQALDIPFGLVKDAKAMAQRYEDAALHQARLGVQNGRPEPGII